MPATKSLKYVAVAMIVCGLLIGKSLRGQDSRKSKVIETECLLLALDQVDVAARRDGVLTTLNVRMGDDVSSQELLFQINDEEAHIRLQIAMSKLQQATQAAENRWDIQTAEIELRKSAKEVELLEHAGGTPYLERFRALSNKRKNEAELRRFEALHQEKESAKQVAEAELQVARADLDQRETMSPVSGTVVKQYRHVGEYCRQGEAVVKILRMDQLMLQAMANIRDIPPHKIVGMKGSVAFQFGDESPIERAGLTITRCSPEVDLDGNYLIWTIIENQQRPSINGQQQWLLRPGISGTLTIDISTPNVESTDT
ncbi:MAG: HlyD family efflux transporter periplasmic adaptor subunit [Pirellulaceae bacterium]